LAVSDGDVVLHAVCDAFCGACALGDIGDHFPPRAKKSKDIESKRIAYYILKRIEKRFFPCNVDVTIIAEKPKLAPHKKKIVDSLKKIFSCTQVNVKIKSKEGLDIFGGKDSIAVFALVSVGLRK
jgi:2-C-methyl-D-erythritol 2,4-cyclodiphosphate synthase